MYSEIPLIRSHPGATLCDAKSKMVWILAAGHTFIEIILVDGGVYSDIHIEKALIVGPFYMLVPAELFSNIKVKLWIFNGRYGTVGCTFDS